MRGFEQIDLVIDGQVIWLVYYSIFFDGALRHNFRFRYARLRRAVLRTHHSIRHAGGVRIEPSSCATPSPIVSFPTQACLDGIVLDVRQGIAKVTFAANITVKGLPRPKSASAPEGFVAFVGGKALP